MDFEPERIAYALNEIGARVRVLAVAVENLNRQDRSSKSGDEISAFLNTISIEIDDISDTIRSAEEYRLLRIEKWGG